MNQPTSALRFLLLSAFALMMALPATAQGTRVYKWQDEHGNVHYSDRLPASQLASNRQVLNRDGIRIRELDAPPPSPDAHLESQEQRRSAQQDMALATSFEDENELRRTHEERLAMIRSGLALARSNSDKLTQALVDQEAHANALGSGQTVPLPLQEQIENTRRMLAEQNEEVVKLELRYDNLLLQQSHELRRYREMAGTR